MHCFSNNIDTLDLLKNKNILLFGDSQQIEKMNLLLTEQGLCVYGYCSTLDFKIQATNELKFIPLNHLTQQIKTNPMENLLVVLAYSPYMKNYDENLRNASQVLSQIGVNNWLETRYILGALNFSKVTKDLNLTEEEGKKILNQFFDELEDNKSKEILNSMIKKDYSPYHDNILSLWENSSKSCKEFLKNSKLNHLKISQGEKIIFYGAGRNAENSVAENQLFLACPEAVNANRIFCDRNYKKGMVFHGYPTITPEELAGDYLECPIVITPIFYRKEIYNSLIQKGVTPDNIYFAHNNDDLLEQYFDEKIIIPSDKEVFVDVGVLNGNSTICFAEKYDYKKIYLFEPNKKSIEMAQKNLDENSVHDYRIFPIGLWHTKDTLIFSGTGGTFGVDGGIYDYCSEQIVEISVDTLDHVLGDEYISFLKMDIEGAEFNALKGAQNVIKTHKPKLAISLYHKPEDLFEIPRYIKSLVPEYKFYLRHYSTGWTETILYAVI